MRHLIPVAIATAIVAASPGLAQGTRTTPVLLTDAEANALYSRHTDATKASNKKHKYDHRVMEMTVLEGRTVRIEVFAMEPDKILAITTMPGMGSSTSGWDGKVGWVETPDTGAELLDSAALSQLKTIVYRKPTAPTAATSALGAPVRVYSLGREVIAGREAKLVLSVTATGDSALTYFDIETGLMAGMRGIRSGGQAVDTNAYILFSDYKRIDGTMLPMKTTIHARDREFVTRIVEYDNKRIDPAKFAPPPAVRGLLSRR